jgi:hypothetical protein
MRYLYLDNFRGFSDTLIPIRDVNFLVGENSTGKTSVLSLLNAFSSPTFWFNQDFNTQETRLGHYLNIVSASSKDKSRFSVGAIDFSTSPRNGDTGQDVNAYLIVFANEGGLPAASRYYYAQGRNEVRVILAKSGISYQTRPYADSKVQQEDVLRAFRGWIHEDAKVDDSWKVISGEKIPFPRRAGLAFIHSFVTADVASQTSSPAERVMIPIPDFCSDLVWIAPIRTRPKRTYDEYRLAFTPEGDHTPYLLKRILVSKSRSSRAIVSGLQEFGTGSGLLDSLKVRQYGKTPTSPFELDVILGEVALNICDLGYGLSQALPVAVELLTRPKNSWFAIQQPEVHLHPRAQAALGDLVFLLAARENKGFFIETHSDFTIDRFRLSYRNSPASRSPDAQVLFFERNSTGNQIHSIQIEPGGGYPDEQPEAFRAFFLREQLALLEL